MIRPAPATIYLKQDYWTMVNSAKVRNNDRSPDWQSDFISIHFSAIGEQHWSLCSSLDLIDQVSGARPMFEETRHETFQEALNAAVTVALEHGKHIVICNDPETGYDLQPDRSRDNGLFINGPAPIQK